MINQDSLDLATHLETPPPPSIRALCNLGAEITRAKNTSINKKSSAKKKGFFDTLFSFGAKAIGGAESLVGKATSLSAKYGGRVPLDKEIAQLTEMKRELNARIAEASGLLSGPVPRLLAQRTPAADLAARLVGDAARAARAEGEIVSRALDSAQAAAQAARRAILSGTSTAKALGIFTVKKAQADQQYTHAKLRFMSMRENYQKALSDTLIKPSQVGAGQWVGGAYQAARQVGGKVRSAAEWAGEAVDTTARGIKQATPLLKYAPYIAVAAAAAYAYQFLPKASKE